MTPPKDAIRGRISALLVRGISRKRGKKKGKKGKKGAVGRHTVDRGRKKKGEGGEKVLTYTRFGR